jgi:hypothetical protein
MGVKTYTYEFGRERPIEENELMRREGYAETEPLEKAEGAKVGAEQAGEAGQGGAEQVEDPGSAVGDSDGSGGSDGSGDQPVTPRSQYFELLKDPEVKGIQQRTIDNAFNSRYREMIAPLKDELEQHRNLLEKLHAVFGTADIASLEAAIDKADELYEAKADARGMSAAQYRAQLETERLAQRYRLEQETRREAEQNQAAINERMSREMAEFAEEFPGINAVSEITKYGALDDPNNEFMRLVKSGLSLVNTYKVMSYTGGRRDAGAALDPAPGEHGGRRDKQRPTEGAAGSGGVTKSTGVKLTEEDIRRLKSWG